MEGCTSSVVLSSSHILPKWSHWRVRQKKQQQFVACVIKITVRYETSSLPQWSHTIYASSIPPSARLDCVWNASHESTRFIPPPAPEFGRQLRSAQTSRCFRQSIKSISTSRLLGDAGRQPGWARSSPTSLSLSALPVSGRNHLHFSLKKGAYFLTLICSL